MKYLCLIYDEEQKFAAMTKSDMATWTQVHQPMGV